MGRVASALHCISPSGASTSPTYPTLDPLAMAAKKGLLERLAQGPVIGDGGFVFALEKGICQGWSMDPGVCSGGPRGSSAASQGVPQGRSWCDAGLHLLCL